MNQEPYSNESIRYLRGELEGDELAQFEARLADDANLKVEIDFLRATREAVREEYKDHLKVLMDDWDGELASSGQVENHPEDNWEGDTDIITGSSRRLGIFLAVAAAIAVLVLIGFFLWPGSSLIDRQRFVAENYSPPANEDLQVYSENVTRGSKEGLLAFQAGDHPKAIRAFERFTGPYPFKEPNPILGPFPFADTIHFFAGRSHLLIPSDTSGKYALAHFQKVVDDSGSVFRMEAEWYQAFAWILQKEDELARSQIEIISTTHSHPRKKDAIDLLKDLPF